MEFRRIRPDPALCAASGAAAGAAALLMDSGWIFGGVLCCFWVIFAPRIRTGIFLLFFAAALCAGWLRESLERHEAREVHQVCQAEIRLTDASLNSMDEMPLPGTILAELRKIDGVPESGRILVWFGEAAPKPLRYGTVCQVEGELQWRGVLQAAGVNAGREYLTAPGFLDFDAYLGARGCRGIFFARKSQTAGMQGGLTGFLLRGRDAVMHAALSGISDVRVKNLIGAMFFGCRQGLDPVSRRDFSRAGVVHLFAVSGLHVAMLAGLLLLPLRLVPFSRRGWLLCLLLGLYVWSTGANPPAVRAFCMIGSWCVLRSSLLFLPGGSILLWTAAWMLCFRPAQLLDIGFLFSFLTAGALVAGSRWIAELRQDCQAGKRYFPAGRHGKPGWGEWLLTALAGCAAAFAAGGFLSLAAFGLFLPGSIFVNLLMIPVTAVLFPLLLLKICCFYLPCINGFLGWCVLQLFQFFDGISTIGGMLFAPESPALYRSWPLLLIYAGFFAFLGGRKRKTLWSAAAVCALGMMLALIPFSPPRTELLLISGAANEEPCVVLADPAAKFGAVINAPNRVAVTAARDFLARRGIARADFAVFTQNRKRSGKALENLSLTIAPAEIVTLRPGGALQKLLRQSPGAAQIRTSGGERTGETSEFSSGALQIFSEKNGFGLVYCNQATDSNIRFQLTEDEWSRTAEFCGHGCADRIVLENSNLPEIRHWEDKR